MDDMAGVEWIISREREKRWSSVLARLQIRLVANLLDNTSTQSQLHPTSLKEFQPLGFACHPSCK
jgi:hypothetical protein